MKQPASMKTIVYTWYLETSHSCPVDEILQVVLRADITSHEAPGHQAVRLRAIPVSCHAKALSGRNSQSKTEIRQAAADRAIAVDPTLHEETPAKRRDIFLDPKILGSCRPPPGWPKAPLRERRVLFPVANRL